MPDFDDEDEGTKKLDRKYNFARRKPVREKLTALYTEIQTGYQEQDTRAADIRDFWDIYNCELSDRQFYSGNSQIFVPAVYNAVNARSTRFSNQIFPVSSRHIEVLSTDPTLPRALCALGEHYIAKADLRNLVPALVMSGDIEGHYNVYVSWSTSSRHVIQKTKKPIETEAGPSIGEVEDIEEIEIKSSHPVVEVIPDTDICVLPATADSLEEAIQSGGSVTILRRWSKTKIRQMISEGLIDKAEGEALLGEMSNEESGGKPNRPKDAASAAGVKIEGNDRWALVYETWSMVETPDGARLCQTFYGGPDQVLSCHRNPLWCDRLPLISAPVKKVAGSFKGRSQVQPVASFQYFINDMMNEGADSASYSMLPIVMTDPEKNPRVGSMVLNLAAVWETSPKDTQFAAFPQLWKDALAIVGEGVQSIFQALGVNPAMITGERANSRPTQAQIANEQQVDILTTADAVSVIEHGILTPMLLLFMEMDYQYRDAAIMVRQYGELGAGVDMEEIPPLQMDHRFSFRWYGVEAARNAQQIQQQIALTNVIRGVPPEMYQGYKLNMGPVLANAVEAAFGPRLGRLVFEDMRSQLSVDPQKENAMLMDGISVMVHPLDDHKLHMQVHSEAMQMGDPAGVIREHLIFHTQALMQAAQAQAAVMAPRPGVGGPTPAGGGGPRIGAQPDASRPAQQPPGAVPQDQMMGQGPAMPRRM
ncbi:MAG: hypothetical protein M0Q93_09075 [Terrimicrobiaceae bacterium]|nr:hypothetical protein [Terrimicrobiaceae bacterium]